MGITVDWTDAEQTIILLTFDPGWQGEDLYLAARTVAEMTAAADHRVGFLLDMREGGAVSGEYFGEEDPTGA